MENYKNGDRVLCQRNGVQFAGTVKQNGVLSDIHGFIHSNESLTEDFVKEKLTGLRVAKVGDIIVDTNGNESKILEIGNNHNAFLKSHWNNFYGIYDWYTWKDAERNGWKLKGEECAKCGK